MCKGHANLLYIIPILTNVPEGTKLQMNSQILLFLNSNFKNSTHFTNKVTNGQIITESKFVLSTSGLEKLADTEEWVEGKLETEAKEFEWSTKRGSINVDVVGDYATNISTTHAHSTKSNPRCVNYIWWYSIRLDVIFSLYKTKFKLNMVKAFYLYLVKL